MPEDALIGFKFFSRGQGPDIASENAVRNATEHLQNEIAFEAAFDHLDRATEAVSTAARRKAAQEPDTPNDDVPEFIEGTDFFIF